MDALAARLRLAALLIGQAAVVAWLHRLGGVVGVDWTDPLRWLALAQPVDALVAGLRLVGLAIGWWLLVSTAAYAVVSLVRLPRAVPAAARATLPACRRIVDRALAVGGVAAVLAAGPVPALGDVVVPPPVVAPAEDAGTAEPLVVPPHVRADAVPGAPDADTGTAGHVVAPGEHLWGVATLHLAQTSGRDPCDLATGEVAPYWRRLVEANRGTLRSGDPDLIHPGERLHLPPITQPRGSARR